MLIKFRPKFFYHFNEVGFVFWSSTVPSWVFPVKIETVEVVLLDESDGVLDETGAGARVAGHFGVLGGTFVPATDGDEGLGARALLAKSVEATETVLAPVVGKVLPCVENLDIVTGETDEGVDQVGAELGVDVFDGEPSGTWTVNCPAAEVADDFLCER